MDLKHILLATDLSDASMPAVSYAALLAARVGARVTVLHVNEFAVAGLDAADVSVAEYLDAVAGATKRGLAHVCSQLDAAGVDHASAVIAGKASEVTARYAAELTCDAIVVGRLGIRNGGKALVGRTTRRLVRRSPVPVLVVPDGVDPVAAVGRVIASTDFSAASTRGLRGAAMLARGFAARLALVHVLELPTIAAGAPGESPLVMPRSVLPGAMEARQTALTTQLAEAGLDDVEAVVIAGHSPAEALCSHAGPTDVLAIPSHGKGAVKRWLLGSTVERVLELCHHPVLVMPHDWLDAMG